MNAKYFLRFPGGKDRAFTLSYDDGVETDVKLAEILIRHGLCCTFNISGGLFGYQAPNWPYKRLEEDQARQLYLRPGFEVASHSLHHPYLTRISLENGVYELVEDRRRLEAFTGGLVTGLALPYCDAREELIGTMPAIGLDYCRYGSGDGGFQMPKDWYHWQPTCRHKDEKLFAYAESFLRAAPGAGPRIFYVWGHSYEFDRDNNWDLMEKFAAYMGSHDHVWYATNMEICHYLRAAEQVRSTADGSTLHNPTATAIWYEIGGETWTLAPGETKALPQL